MDAPVLVTPPIGDVVALADAKAHLRIFYNDDDDLLTTLIRTATALMDGWRGKTGRCLLTQTWATTHWGWPDWCRDYFLSPFPDIQDVAIQYRDKNGVDQTVDASFYMIDADRVRFTSGFSLPALTTEGSTRPIRVEWTCGYGETADVPDEIKMAIKMTVAHWYENRAATTAQNLKELPVGPRDLIEHFKAFR